MDTRQKILGAAIQVYGQHGFRGATTRRIAAAAGVNEVTVFRRFGTKESLLNEALSLLAIEGADHPLPPEPGNALEELTDWCHRHLNDLRSRPAMIRACIGEVGARRELSAGVSVVSERAFAELRRYLRDLHSAGRISGDPDSDAAAAMLLGALFADAMARDMVPAMFPPEDQAARCYVRLLLRALGLGEPVPATTVAPVPPFVPDATGA